MNNKITDNRFKGPKINIYRIILIVLLICTFSVIFSFSSQDSKKSSSLSRRIAELITNNIKWIQEKPKQEKEQIIKQVHIKIRKIAHLSIYTILGIILMAIFSTAKAKALNRLGASLIVGIILATSDEIHQCFVPGRGPLFTDVVIDSLGVLYGILVVMIVQKIYVRIVAKKKRKLRITKKNVN